MFNSDTERPPHPPPSGHPIGMPFTWNLDLWQPSSSSYPVVHSVFRTATNSLHETLCRRLGFALPLTLIHVGLQWGVGWGPPKAWDCGQLALRYSSKVTPCRGCGPPRVFALAFVSGPINLNLALHASQKEFVNIDSANITLLCPTWCPYLSSYWVCPDRLLYIFSRMSSLTEETFCARYNVRRVYPWQPDHRPKNLGLEM